MAENIITIFFNIEYEYLSQYSFLTIGEGNAFQVFV